MKILILGSEGFIGSNLVSYFLKQGDDVSGCDLKDSASQRYRYVKVSAAYPEWDFLFAEGQFSCCINAAGSANVGYSVAHPVVDFEANTLETIRVLDAIRRSSPSCRYLFISSAAVYGNPRKLPIQESDPCSPMSPYGWHKLLSEQICKEYSSIYGIHTAIVRPFSVFGPGLRKQLFWDIFLKYSGGDQQLKLFGTGEESRDFIFISDLVTGLDMILKKSTHEGEIYNMASGQETTIRDVITPFLQYLNWSPEVSFNQEMRSGDPLNWRADVSKLTSLGFEIRTTLPEGLQTHAKWLKMQTPFSGPGSRNKI